MPSEYRIAVESDLTYVRHFGRQTIRGQRRSLEAYLADPNYRLGRPEFVDLSELIIKRVDFSHTSRFANQVNKQLSSDGDTTLSVIWAPTDATFAASRMYQSSIGATLGPHINVYISRDEGEALAALGVRERSVANLLAAHDFGPVTATPDC